jgi:acetyl-CoA carboxylase alpha subunit
MAKKEKKAKKSFKRSKICSSTLYHTNPHPEERASTMALIAYQLCANGIIDRSTDKRREASRSANIHSVNLD